MGTFWQDKLKFIYVIWGFLECIGFGGLIFGWSAFVYVLKDEGLYQELCVNTTMKNISVKMNFTIDCPERDSMLQLVFTIASMCVGLGSFVLGQINFTLGMRVSRILSTIFFMCGALIIAFTTNDLPWLIFPGMALVSFGGMAMILTNVQLSNMFAVGGGTVVGIIIGAYGASAGIQLLVKVGYEHGISRKTSYLILACASVMTLVSTFFFLPKDYVHPVQEKSIYDQEIEFRKPGLNDSAPKKVTKESILITKIVKKPESVHDLMRNIFSSTFSQHVLWLSLLQLQLYCTLGSMNKTLTDQLGTEEKVSSYTNIMVYILMGDLITSPMAGAFLELIISLCKDGKSPLSNSVRPTIIPLMVTSTLGVLLSVISLFENPSLLYYIFVLILVFRSFLYTMSNAFIIRVFPSKLIGSLLGVATLTAGVFSLLQNALFEWSFKRNTREVNIFLTALTSLSFIHPIWHIIACRRADTLCNGQNKIKI